MANCGRSCNSFNFRWNVWRFRCYDFSSSTKYNHRKRRIGPGLYSNPFSLVNRLWPFMDIRCNRRCLPGLASKQSFHRRKFKSYIAYDSACLHNSKCLQETYSNSPVGWRKLPSCSFDNGCLCD